MSWRRGEVPNRKRWNRVRAVVLEAANYTCARCGRWGNQCDHVVPLHQDGEVYAMRNLQILCRKCHWKKTSLENGPGKPTPELDEWAEFVASM